MRAYLNLTMNNNLGVYVHFPFCKKKCAYCDFVSFPRQDLIDDYISLVTKEISLCDENLKNREVATVYFGGGTPSLLPTSSIERVFDAIKSVFSTSGKFAPTELTIECNPESLTKEKLNAYKSMGFNRISIGVQSLNDDILKLLGRVHDASTAIKAIESAVEVFDNVSCDLMLGLPKQNLDDVSTAISTFKDFGVKHLSCYTLQVEDGTRLCEQVKNKQIVLPNDDIVADCFSKVIDMAEDVDYKRYEVSNFAVAGYESKHNCSYWDRVNYRGYGVSAHSMIDDVRFSNPNTIEEYAAVLSGRQGRDYSILSVDNVRFEKIMLGLRQVKGVPKDCFCGYEDTLNKYSEFFDFIGDRVALNKRGFEVMNSILVEFM